MKWKSIKKWKKVLFGSAILLMVILVLALGFKLPFARNFILFSVENFWWIIPLLIIVDILARKIYTKIKKNEN